MKNKNLVMFAVLVFAFSFSFATPIVIAQDQPVPSEPAPAPAPSEPVPEPTVPTEPTEPTEPTQPTEPIGGGEGGEPKPTEPLPPPPPPAPPGCTQEVDQATGSVRTICEEFRQTCPSIEPGMESKCSDNGGRPNYFPDAAGCKAFRCEFQKHEEGGGFFSEQKCSPEEEQKQSFEKCNAIGGRAFVRNVQGCNVVDCDTGGSRRQRGPECPQRSAQDYQREGMACGQKGGRIVSNFDENGCNIQRCVGKGEGFEDRGEFRGPPERAYKDCNAKGGEIITQQDDDGRVVFARCVAPGDERDIEYDEIRKVPPATKLLSLALQLENVKIEFDKLVAQTSDIAKYYESTGDQAGADRFYKAASMFEGAKAKMDEIKNKMRDRIKGITREDVSEILHDIKYVREVMMEDILYVMLSTDGAQVIEERAIDEIRTSTKAEIKDGVIQCGDNGMCFDKAIRTCTPALFNPPDDLGGADRIDIEIKGIEGTTCVFTGAVIVKQVGTVADMTCKYPKYTFGLRGPEDIMPYCEGSMKDGFERSQREGRMPTRRGPSPGEFDDRGGFDDRRGEFDDRRTSTRSVREDFPEEEERFPETQPTGRIAWP